MCIYTSGSIFVHVWKHDAVRRRYDIHAHMNHDRNQCVAGLLRRAEPGSIHRKRSVDGIGLAFAIPYSDACTSSFELLLKRAVPFHKRVEQ
jgi:hypothetical protein